MTREKQRSTEGEGARRVGNRGAEEPAADVAAGEGLVDMANGEPRADVAAGVRPAEALAAGRSAEALALGQPEDVPAAGVVGRATAEPAAGAPVRSPTRTVAELRQMLADYRQDRILRETGGPVGLPGEGVSWSADAGSGDAASENAGSRNTGSGDAGSGGAGSGAVGSANTGCTPVVPDWTVVRGGVPAVERALPRGGFPRPGVVEVCGTEVGAGATQIALRIALAAAGGGGSVGVAGRVATGASAAGAGRGSHRAVIIVDPGGDFYPPAVVPLGFDLGRVVVVRPRSSREAFWAVEQCLRCRAVGAVVALFADISDVQSRRLQLAAECGAGFGLLVGTDRRRAAPHPADTVRPQACPPPGGMRCGKSFATVSLLVEAVPESDGCPRCRIMLTRVREGRPAGPVEVDLDAAADSVPVSTLSAPRTPEDRPPQAAG